MNLELSVFSGKEDFVIDDTNSPLVEQIDEDSRYYFDFTVGVYHKKKEVGVIHGLVYDESAMLDDGYNPVDVADWYSQEAHDAIFCLVNNPLYKIKHPDHIFHNTFLAYISKFYVDPEYRGRGIGKFLIHNLYDILLYTLNIHVRCFTIIPRDDVSSDMKKIMIKTIEDAGYKQINKEMNVYALNSYNQD